MKASELSCTDCFPLSLYILLCAAHPTAITCGRMRLVPTATFVDHVTLHFLVVGFCEGHNAPEGM